jgi:hypothetical protein
MNNLIPHYESRAKMVHSTERPQRFAVSRNVLWSAVFDGLGPYLVYRLVSPHTSLLVALAWTMLPPGVSNLVTLARRRRPDIIGLIVIAGIAVGLLLFLLGGSARLLLIRESFITGAIGLLFLLSLFFRRPLSYYISRQFVTGDDPARATRWNSQYEVSRYKFGMPRITAVWGAVLLGEAGLRTVLAFSLPISLFLALHNFIFIAVYAATMAWCYSYGWRTYKREKFADVPAI